LCSGNGRTVTVPEAAATSRQMSTPDGDRASPVHGQPARRPRAAGDQPDGRRHGRRRVTQQPVNATVPPLPTGARVGAAGAPARRL